MMTGESFLLTLAQLGVGIAGFSGLIVALPRATPQSSQVWRLNEIAGVKLILEYSFSLVLLSLLPIIIFRFSASEETSWYLATWLAALFVFLEVVIQVIRMSVAYKNISPPRSPSLLLLMLVPGALLLAIKFMFIIDPYGWYGLVLLWIILSIGIQFWFFIKEHITYKTAVTGANEGSPTQRSP